jgi:ATP-dependent DNA ligase
MFKKKMMNEVYYTIYKKDTKGRPRVLNIYSDRGELVQESGLVGGKLTKHAKMCKPKNIGRSNETSPYEQAIAQAKSKLKEKLKAGYFMTMKEAQDTEIILPMLAKSFKDEKDKVDWTNAYAQPKFDGQRCLAIIDSANVINPIKLMSRLGTPIETMPHIVEALKALKLVGKHVLDGELYIHGQTFQENMRLIKKERPESVNVAYHIYDTITELPFMNRHDVISYLLTDNKSKCLKTVETIKIDSQERLDQLNKGWVSQGYEGSMVRWGDEFYKVNGRSSHLLKNKAFLDTTAIVMDIVPDDSDATKGTAVLFWEGATYRGVENRLGTNMKGSHDYCRELLLNKDDYIGKTGELRFFEYSEKGVPRFPVFHGFRNDK